MVLGILKVEVYMESNRSLKDKRKVVRSLIAKVKSKFNNISVSEVDHLNYWKKSTLGISFVSNETSFVNSVIDQVLEYIEKNCFCHILGSESNILHF